MVGRNSSKRKSLWAILFIIGTVCLMGGCGLNQPLEISLAPKVSTVPINIGVGTRVDLSVLDQRPEKILGYKVNPDGLRYFGVEVRGTISASEDITGSIQKSLENGLTSLGFVTLTAHEPSTPKLEVAVQRLRYNFLPTSRDCPCWVIDGVITGKLYKGNTLLYDKSYAYTRQYTFGAFPIARPWFEENFNAALSDLMGQLLADLELLQALR
jgi:uncharacterized lipoprotein YajG